MLYQRTDPDEAEAVEAAMHSGIVAATPPAPSAPAWQASSYQPATRGRAASIFGSGLVVGGLLVALFSLGGHPHHRHHRPRMILLDLPIEPPPPPPTPQPIVTKAPQPDPAPEIFAPPPIVTPPVATPNPVAVSPAPVPPPPMLVVQSAPPAPPAPPAPAPSDLGDISSKMISATPPAYPLESRRRHEQGTVVLAVMLGTDGRVADLAVSSSSGSDRLDHAALAAVKHWRWSPILRDGAPVLVRGLVRIPFVLAS